MKKDAVRKFATAGLLTVLVVAGALAILLLPWNPTPYEWQQARMVDRVMKSEPEALLAACRDLISQQPDRTGLIPLSSPSIPEAIRRLRPTRISIHTNGMSVHFSDAFNPFGITVFRAGSQEYAPAYGRREWIDGLWLFHDGQLEEAEANNEFEETSH